MALSTHVLREMATRLAGSIPIVGVGGILSGDDAVAKFEAGASLVQFYTGMIYRGPELIGECVEALRKAGVGGGD
jgi:dihydroorotate dehydrogenase